MHPHHLISHLRVRLHCHRHLGHSTRLTHMLCAPRHWPLSSPPSAALGAHPSQKTAPPVVHHEPPLRPLPWPPSSTAAVTQRVCELLDRRQRSPALSTNVAPSTAVCARCRRLSCMDRGPRTASTVPNAPVRWVPARGGTTARCRTWGKGVR